jgi:hypothetical protein
MPSFLFIKSKNSPQGTVGRFLHACFVVFSSIIGEPVESGCDQKIVEELLASLF